MQKPYNPFDAKIGKIDTLFLTKTEASSDQNGQKNYDTYPLGLLIHILVSRSFKGIGEANCEPASPSLVPRAASRDFLFENLKRFPPINLITGIML